MSRNAFPSIQRQEAEDIDAAETLAREIAEGGDPTDYDSDDEPDHEEEEEEHDNTCGDCAGTGEGQHEFQRCWRCKGKGYIVDKSDEY